MSRARRSISRAAGPRTTSRRFRRRGTSTAGATLNLFFGGVQAVEWTTAGGFEAAGDPRRGGVGIVVRDDVRPATPHDAQALVDLAESVGREEGRWILGTGPWRSVVRRAPLPPEHPAPPRRGRLRRRGRRATRRPALTVPRSTPGEPTRGRPRAHGRREPSPPGRRDGAPRRRGRLGARGGCPQARAARLPVERACARRSTARSASSARAIESATTSAETSSSTPS